MKKVLLFACIVFLLFPYSLLSQSKFEFIEPLWDLMPNESAYELEESIIDIIETDDGCYIVPLFGNHTKIIKFNDDGEILKQVELPYNENFICGSNKS